MADNNRNQSYNRDWNRNDESLKRQQKDWNQGGGGYNEDLKGGYGGSEYGDSYYRAGYQNQNRNRVNYIPDNDDNDYGSYGQVNRSNWGNQNYQGYQDQYNRDHDSNRNYGGSQYGNDYNPGGYGRVGNTGGSFNDTGGYGNRSYNDRNRDYGSSYNDRQRNYGNYNSREDVRGDRDWWDRTKDEVSSWFGDDDAERRRESDRRYEGEHKGKGPRGYQRSADRIREDACDRLSDDPFVDASDIEVKVEGNEVILTGSVNSKDAKRRAEDIVESISGVRNVENRIRVDRDRSNDWNTTNRNYTAQDYTGTSDQVGNIGSQSGTTNEIIRNSGKGRS